MKFKFNEKMKRVFGNILTGLTVVCILCLSIFQVINEKDSFIIIPLLIREILAILNKAPENITELKDTILKVVKNDDINENDIDDIISTISNNTIRTISTNEPINISPRIEEPQLTQKTVYYNEKTGEYFLNN